MLKKPGVVVSGCVVVDSRLSNDCDVDNESLAKIVQFESTMAPQQTRTRPFQTTPKPKGLKIDETGQGFKRKAIPKTDGTCVRIFILI
jgi:hypothetical protein